MPMFDAALPMMTSSWLMQTDFVYPLSQNPLIGLQVKIVVRIVAIHQATTAAVTILATDLNLGTANMRRYKERMDSLINVIEVL